jgi:hypothetical protein
MEERVEGIILAEKSALFVETFLATSVLPSSDNAASRNVTSFVCATAPKLMHWSLRAHAWVELDFSEGALVTGHILLQKSQQRLSLLRAEVNALEVLDLDMALGLLLQRAENQKEVPDIDPHLHAVGVAFAVRGIVR